MRSLLRLAKQLWILDSWHDPLEFYYSGLELAEQWYWDDQNVVTLGGYYSDDELPW